MVLKHLPIEFNNLLEKLSNYAKLEDYNMSKENKTDFVELKFFNSRSPGVIRIYRTKKGLTIDGSSGKNIELNKELLQFINEVTSVKETEEKRINFKNVSMQDFEDIIIKIRLFSDGEATFEIENIKVTNSYEEQHLVIKETISKEEVHLIYYTNGSLYLYGFAWNLGEEIINIICKTLGRANYQPINYINEIIHNCNEKYITDDGIACKSCRNSCNGNCSKYLQEIHYGSKKRYSCSRVINFYLPKYGYRYAYELEKLLENHLTQIRSYDSINILSIGCGPCTDLFGIANLNNSCNKPIKYYGIDLNDKWGDIHAFLKNLFCKEAILKFYYKDIFDFIGEINPTKTELKSNIVIFQYVISDMLKYKSKVELQSFINKLFDELIEYLPRNALIIFNDINHKDKARDTFEYIESILSKDKYKIYKYHFKNKTDDYFNYGIEIEDNQVPYLIPDYIDNRYNPWIMCRSAALIIGKVG